MKKPMFLFLLTVSFSTFANAKDLSCLTTTGQHFCRTQKVVSTKAVGADGAKIVVSAENFYGCEDLYDSVTTMDLQADGTWLSADGKRSLTVTDEMVRFDDKDLVYDYDGFSGMSRFDFSTAQCK